MSVGNFGLGNSTSHLPQVPFEGAEGRLAALKTAKGMELIIKTIKTRNL